MTPLIVLAFANDKNDSLDLKTEYGRLMSLFNDSSKLEPEPIESADVNKISTRLTQEKKDRTVIFHYGGHADGKNIKLLDGDAKIDGFSRLLAEFPNLQLVFLNCCDSFDQAAKIQAQNPNVSVLATLIPVGDSIAIDFAYYFYLAYYRLNTLNNSFEFAQTRIMMQKDNSTFIKLTRGFGDEDNRLTADGPKSTYALSCPGRSCLNKTLFLNLDIEKRNQKGLGYKPNRKLILEIAKSIVTGNFYDATFPKCDDIEHLEEYYDKYIQSQATQTNENLRNIVEKLLSILPYPVGFHLNLQISNAKDYFSSDEKHIDLLKRQIVTYNCMIQLLCYMLLSCLWLEMEKGSLLIIEPHQRKILQDFISSENRDSQEVNFAMLLVNLHNILHANSLDIFVLEYQYLKNIFKNENSLHDAHLYIQGVNTSIHNKTIAQQDINRVCMEIEDILCQIFAGTGFIVKYKLATIKNIELIKSRLKAKPSYFIKRIILDRFVVVEDDIVEYPVYTNSRSVILAKSLMPDVLIDFLPLSPFLFDENALKGENLSKLYFYSHCLGDGYIFRLSEDPDKTLLVKRADTYEYLYKKDDDEVQLINLRMSEIWKELKAFQLLISGNSSNK